MSVSKKTISIRHAFIIGHQSDDRLIEWVDKLLPILETESWLVGREFVRAFYTLTDIVCSKSGSIVWAFSDIDTS